MAIRRHHLATVIAIACAILLAGCTSQPLEVEQTVTSTPARTTRPTATVEPTADAASTAAAQGRLDSAVVPAQATAQSVRPDGVPKKLNMTPICDPQAVAVGFWTVPGMSVTELMGWLRANPSPGMGVSSTSGPVEGSAESVRDGVVVETVGGVPANNGLVFSIAPTADGAAFRADAIVIPTDATCPTPVPGVVFALG